MSVEIGYLLFLLTIVSYAGAMISIMAVFAVHFFVPKKLLEEYFRPPYFREGEVLAFTGFPLGYIRTVMFMRLAAYPESGKKRGLTRAYELAPIWFRRVSKLIVNAIVSFSIPMVLLSLYFFFTL